MPGGAELLKELEIRPYTEPGSQDALLPSSKGVGLSTSCAPGGVPDCRQPQDYIDEFGMMTTQRPRRKTRQPQLRERILAWETSSLVTG